MKITRIKCNYIYLFREKNILVLRVSVSWFLLVWDIDSLSLFLRIYITLVVFIIIRFLDDIEVWFHILVVFRCSWILHIPENIIVDSLLDFILLVMNPSSKAYVFYLVPCIILFLDVVVLKDSTYHTCYGKIFSYVLSKSYFKFTMWSGFTIGSRRSMHWLRFALLFFKGVKS